jgi:prevent-host-death family protein
MKQTQTYSSSQARAQWRDVLDLAAAGTDVVIERHGKPMVAVIAYDDYVVLQDKLDVLRMERQNNAYYLECVENLRGGSDE